MLASGRFELELKNLKYYEVQFGTWWMLIPPSTFLLCGGI